MSKSLLLKVKMRRIDIPVNEIGRYFQTFSVADEGLGEMTCSSAGLHYLYSPPLGKKSHIWRYIPR